MNVTFMKTRPIKFKGLLCLLPLLAFAQSIGNAQPSIVNAEPRFDINIENGQLSLAPLNGRVDVNQFALGEGAQPADIKTVPATIDNLSRYVRAVAPDLNIVVAPQAAAVQIKDLKLRAADMAEVVEAAELATDEAVHGGPSSGKNNWHIVALPQKDAVRKVEVFNISGYIHSLGNPSNDEIARNLAEFQVLIHQTLAQLHKDNPKPPPSPQISFHRGTSMLIVIASPEDIEVIRKFINALPGQSAAELEQLGQSAFLLNQIRALDTSTNSKQK
jgi:hypothetical protein